MIPDSRAWLNVLRLGLLLSGIGWGISFFFTFASWEVATDQLRAMGAQPIRYQPLLDYWLRMASAVFGCVGLGALMCCVWPREFVALIRLVAPFHLFVGAVLVVSAWSNHFTLRDEPTSGADIGFCFLVAVLTGAPLRAGGGHGDRDTASGQGGWVRLVWRQWNRIRPIARR